MELIKKLSKIQKELKAPKNQFNKFGGYNYRSCEDILEAVKPLLENLILTITDEIELIGNRYYVKATARIQDENQSIENVAYAREAETKKGMDESQITGAASSYARKYALNGLFLIDDTKDADHYDNTAKPQTNSNQTVTSNQAINLLKVKANNAGAKTEAEAVKIIIDRTGVDIKSFADLTNDKAKNVIELWTDLTK